MQRKVLIRADGNTQIGLGHLIRCSALGHMLKDKFEIIFFCRSIPESLQDEFINTGFRIFLINDETEFLDAVSPNGIIVLDGYHFDTNYQKIIKNTGAILVCIDDLHDKEFVADLIINYTPGVSPQDYNAKPFTRFALGLDYALLRPVFLEQAATVRKIKKIENILICFGGSDFYNLSEKTLKVVQKYDHFKKIIVIAGAANLATIELQELINKDPRIVYKNNLDPKALLDNLLSTELAVVSASTIALEVICAGSMLITCMYVKNQLLLYKYLIGDLNTGDFGNNSTKFQKKKLVASIDNMIHSNEMGNQYVIRERISHSNKNILCQFNLLNSF